MYSHVTSLTQTLDQLPTAPTGAFFDIDGTVSDGSFVEQLLNEVLSDLNLSTVSLAPILGKASWMTREWISANVRGAAPLAGKVVNRFRDRFLTLPRSVFDRALYPDAIETIRWLHEQGTIVGIFSLRDWRLALHQVRHSEIADFVYAPTTMYQSLHITPPTTPLKVTGAGLLTPGHTPRDEKCHQLQLHLLDFRLSERPDLVVFGDSEETDMFAANAVGALGFLIDRLPSNASR